MENYLGTKDYIVNRTLPYSAELGGKWVLCRQEGERQIYYHTVGVGREWKFWRVWQ